MPVTNEEYIDLQDVNNGNKSILPEYVVNKSLEDMVQATLTLTPHIY